MTGQAQAQIQDDDGEVVEAKPDNPQIFGSKKVQEEFDQHCGELVTRIGNLNGQVIELNRLLNRRNNNVVNEVTQIIHSVLHETQDVTQDVAALQDISKSKPMKGNLFSIE
jgi:uncharacterized protein involved in exopolysaccharide biosynthesis